MKACLRNWLGVVWVVGLAHLAVARDDQVWMSFAGEARCGQGFNIKVEETLKFDNDRLFASETLLLAGWTWNKYFSAYAGSCLARERGKDGHFATEHRPTVDLCFAAPEFATLKFDFRSRVEWRDKAGAQGYLRFRERLRLRTGWSVTDFRISPYLSGEFFFSDKPKADDADLFDRSRAQIGVTFNPLPTVKELSASLFFMVQHDMSNRSSTWTPTNIYGFTLTYKF